MFDEINLPADLGTISVAGDKPLALLSRGDVFIGAAIDGSGASALLDGERGKAAGHGGPGGGAGGSAQDQFTILPGDSGAPGEGAGGGAGGLGSRDGEVLSGAGGGFGGDGTDGGRSYLEGESPDWEMISITAEAGTKYGESLQVLRGWQWRRERGQCFHDERRNPASARRLRWRWRGRDPDLRCRRRDGHRRHSSEWRLGRNHGISQLAGNRVLESLAPAGKSQTDLECRRKRERRRGFCCVVIRSP